jgi:hypothetical protein
MDLAIYVILFMTHYTRNLGYKAGDLPESERAAREVRALPVYLELFRSALSPAQSSTGY